GGPIEGSGTEASTPPNTTAGGAVQSIAVDPFNSSKLFLGTVDGGVWRTNNFNTANPGATLWTPLTDHAISLSIGSAAFSPLDDTGNTVFAGTAQFTAGAGPSNAGGLLRTVDGGATWSLLGANTFSGQDIRVVLPT